MRLRRGRGEGWEEGEGVGDGRERGEEDGVEVDGVFRGREGEGGWEGEGWVRGEKRRGVGKGRMMGRR